MITLFISGLLVYATNIDRTVYITEQLIVVPGVVTTDSWAGKVTVLVQDLSGDALYQNFSEANSAFISGASLEAPSLNNATQTDNTDEENDSPMAETVTSSSEPSTMPVAPDEVEPSSLDTAEPVEVVPELIETSLPSTPDTPVPSVDGATSESVSLKRDQPILALTSTNVRYPWAQLSVTESVIPESTPTDSSEEGVEVPISESIITETEVPATLGVEVSEPTAPATGEVTADNIATSTSGENQLFNDTDSDPEPEATPTSSSAFNLFGLKSCDSIVGCASKTLTFTGFDLPEFIPGTVLDGVQLRLSLAAKAKPESEVQRFVISYSYDDISWSPASVIDVEGETSNSINGDHFLVTIGTPQAAADLALLTVRVTYEGIAADLEGAFVDGVWLEVNSGTFYEDGAGIEATDEITYERELEAPKFNEMMSPDLDVRLGEVPEFTFEYIQQQNFIYRVFRGLFADNLFSIKTINVSHVGHGHIDIPFEIIYHEDTTWSLKLPNSPQGMHPGKYEVTVTINENDSVYTDTFEFYWGVLAVNTKKSMYFPNEDVELNLAALTDKGDTICDANLELKIIDPKNNIYEVPVEQSGECGKNNVTDVPDYLAQFTNTGEWGLYTIQLQHKNKDGVVVHKIVDSFEVRDYIPFDIERTAPTRIYPPAPYNVTLDIKANRDFTGDINERVPRGFVLSNIDAANISTLPEYTLITWKDVTMKEGDSIKLAYTFDAPDITPYMFCLLYTSPSPRD